MDNVLYLHKKNIKFCKNFKNRLLGMMFKKNKNNTIYFFPKCNSIHTFFMFKHIDIIMTDKNNNIIKCYKNFKPWKIILPKTNVHNIYEMDINLINNIEKYNKIEIK